MKKRQNKRQTILFQTVITLEAEISASLPRTVELETLLDTQLLLHL